MQSPFTSLDPAMFRQPSPIVETRQKAAVINNPSLDPVDRQAAMIIRRANWLEMPPPEKRQEIAAPPSVCELVAKLKEARATTEKLKKRCAGMEAKNAALQAENAALLRKFESLCKRLEAM
jgi:hypothetical protein